MVDTALFVLTLASALGCGLIAGVFFAFSAFVMKALARLPAGDGVAAMQSINVGVLKSRFLTVFLGTAITCGATIIVALVRWPAPGAGWFVAGGVFYLAGCLLVTRVRNVPLNDALATLALADPESPRRWADYRSRRTAWNHVRTAASLAAAAALTIGLSQ